MITMIAENIKTVGACVSAVTALCGGYVYLDGPLPVSKQWVVSETQTIKRDVIDSRLQLNTVQRNLVRKEQFDRELELQKAPEPQTKALLQQRLNQIKDDLDNLENERDELKKK